MKFWQLLFLLSLCFCAFSIGIVLYLAQVPIDIQSDGPEKGKPTILLDDEGNEWARFSLEKKEPVEFNQLPQCLINAFIAAEDWGFFSHKGISFKGIIRSLFVNIYHRKRLQGASTITQQLVRLLYFDSRKTVIRKIKEQLTAIVIEWQYTKEQILEAYLNNVYFGCGIYGVRAACSRFWSKPIEQINLDEAAVLAGIVACPGYYCPLINLQKAEKRRNIVLSQMKKLKFISPQEYETYKNNPLSISPETQLFAPHFKETIRQQLEEIIGKKELYTGGYVVQTTLNRRMQETAQYFFNEHCNHLRTQLKKPVDGGLISVEVQTGGTKVLIGGHDFKKSQFNRATQAKRQIGSIVKPLIYACAIEQELCCFTDTEIDEPIEVNLGSGRVWKPHNYNERFEGQMTYAYALSHSNNILAIKLLEQIGVPTVLKVIKQCKLQPPAGEYLSIALGCIDASVKQTAGMFNVIANKGKWVEPYTIEWIKNEWGQKIWRATYEKEYLFSPSTADQIAQVLSLGLKRLCTLSQLDELDGFAFCKTGTTNDWRTVWFAGSTPAYTTVTYLGLDNNQPLGKNVFPFRTTFPLWLSYNRVIEQPKKEFVIDKNLKEIYIHEKTGKKIASSEVNAFKILIKNS